MITKQNPLNNIEMSESEAEFANNSAPRKLKKKHYDQKYSSLWEMEKDYAGWIQRSQKGDKYFHCKVCSCDLKCGGGKFVISKHANSYKHLSNAKEAIDSEEELTPVLKVDRKSWLSDPRLSEWIIEVNDKEVKCKYCQCVIKSKLSILLSHLKTNEHIEAASNLKTHNKKFCQHSMASINTNFSKPTCRVCLQNKDEEMSSIFDVDADLSNLHIYEEIEQCAGIKILRYENMPTLICANCYELLKYSYKFRTICRDSDEYIKEFMVLEAKDEKVEITHNKNPLSISENISKQEVTRSQYKTSSVESTTAQSQNENVSLSNTLKNSEGSDDDNFKEDLQMWFDDDENDISCGENVEISTDQLDLDIKEKPMELDQIMKNVKRNKKLTAKEEESSTVNASKTLEISSDGAAIIREKKEKQSHICEICGNIYYRRCALLVHMRRHRAEKLYECEICSNAFHSSAELIRHIRKHTGSRPYKCSYCSRAFGDKSTLIKHERIHRNEKPFKCEVCGKSFTYSSVLKYHKYVHTGEKPYTCELCGRCFTRPHHLRSHLETLQHQSDPRTKILLQRIGKRYEN